MSNLCQHLARVVEHTLPRILLYVAVILLAGCEGPYTTTQEPTQTHVTLVVQWAEPEAVQTQCRDHRAGGCTFGNLIIVPKPASFNDERRLVTLGHEVLHVLGARHD